MLFADLLPYEMRGMYNENVQRDLNEWGNMMASQIIIEMQEAYKFRIMGQGDHSISL
jgi:hypothetical protein